MTPSCKKCINKYAKPLIYWAALIVIPVSNAITDCVTVVVESATEPLQKHVHGAGKRQALVPCFISSRSKSDPTRGVFSSSPARLVGGAQSLYQRGSSVEVETEQEYFVSDAQFVHLSPAARILTEEFYSQRTNFITFQIERLKTVLSLESTFPNQRNSVTKEYSSKPLQQMIVACNSKNGEVVGFAEVDARPLGSSKSTGVTETAGEVDGSNNILRSYMYNLAVDKKWKRKGIASALVKACEGFVSDRHDSCIEKRLYLRVRKCNLAAVALYEKLGYTEMDPKTISLSKEDINSGSLEEGELILFAKDLPIDDECVME
mmetsp:Transcript_29536/g.62237  ORF Transcript_29536/g.62237 Transcript_29536/m.62237 type:complete len:319 (+) Transcript_29536:86-1042(+)|eukprot:CAMPEP_0183710414 /NCGR_PEP_ID=MMETSP0737-20130205/6149_1 /TAXON_ID=385413 /ORGANISM="Thalassiosira miniscula, Strain CCMP1093" /LENGTH=318 /DNA_ID=CAMNT_0025938675 /DNA_START=75 /DNA_END=1031 /DNA_ORIENTATION=+